MYASYEDKATTVRDAFGTLGDRFKEPRPVQTEVLEQLAAERPRVAFVEAPVGIGKSGIAVCYGELLRQDEAPTVALTATISLQEQYERDFDGMVLVKGRGNFPCTVNGLTAAEGVCTLDRTMECDSPYYLQRVQARASGRVAANYAVYLYEEVYSQSGFLGLGRRGLRPRLLVCDEAHRLLDQLTEFETLRLDAKLASDLGVGNDGGWASLTAASRWARDNLRAITYGWEQAVAAGDRAAKRWLALRRQALRFATVPEDYIELEAGPVTRAAPLWPRSLARSVFAGADHVLAMSATLYGGHLLADLLGLRSVTGQDPIPYAYYTVPSPFDPRRWPVHFQPVAELNKQSGDAEWGAVSATVHQYVHSMHGTKGVIHVTAANQVERVVRQSLACPDCAHRLVYPGQRAKEDRAAVLQRFRSSPAGTWLCHYSVGEGESFDDGGARLQLIVKTPYPDLGDKLTRLRAEDSTVGRKMYAAMTLAKLAQTAGRVMRHEKDYGETVILDGTFRRLWSWHKQLAPSWFAPILKRYSVG